MNGWVKKDGEEKNLTQGMAFLWKDLGSGQWLKLAGHFSEGEEWNAKEEQREFEERGSKCPARGEELVPGFPVNL